MKKSKVFVGPGNVAGNAMYIAKALRNVGIYSHSYSYSRHPFGYKTDYELFHFKLNERMRFKKIFRTFLIGRLSGLTHSLLLIYSIFKYNTFFFISTITFYKKHWDLPVLKFFRKKIAFMFVGCPERDPKDKINLDNEGVCSICGDVGKQKYCLCNKREKKRKLIRFFEKYSDYIFTLKDTATFLLDNKKQFKIYIISDPANKHNLLDKYSTNIINIAHFPSNKKLKGTKYVKKAINKIKQKYGNKIKYISKRVSNEEVLGHLEKIHILIDQFTFGHGLLAVEAMARGCVVIARISDWFREERPELPVVNTEIRDLEKNLINLIENPEKMKKIARKSIEYYYKYHSPKAVGNYYKRIMDLK